MNTVYYHGGVVGLQPGGYILPPCKTDADSSANWVPPGTPNPIRTDRVYITTDEGAARTWAALRGVGDVYVVIPLGELEPDPDCKVPGLSWQVSMARVVACVERGVRLAPGALEAMA